MVQECQYSDDAGLLNQSNQEMDHEPTEPLINRILSFLDILSKEDPTRLAVIEGANEERKLTNGELRDRVLATASFLRSRGFGRADRATIAVPNMIEFPISYLGVWAAGGTVIGSSVAFKAHESHHQLLDSSPKIVVTTEEYLPTIMAVLDKCPSVEMVLCIRSTSAPLPEGVIDFSSVIAHPIDGQQPDARLDDVSHIYYTSGTTGLRKGVLHTHRGLRAATELLRSYWRHDVYPALGMDEKAIKQVFDLITVPCYHISGFNRINTSLIIGSPVVLIKGNEDGTLLKCIEKYRPTCLVSTAAMFLYLSKEERADLSSVKLINSGGTYLRESVANALLRRFPHIDYIVQRYGMTEFTTCHLHLLNHKGFNPSVGVLAPKYHRKLINVHTGEPCKQGERGEVLLKGPSQTIGYLNRPEATQELFDSEGFVRTGDIGYVDDLGQLHIVDRSKDLLKVIHDGFISISPSEIEDAILTCSKVADVGVVGIPHEERESLLRAYVVKADEALTADEVEAIVKEKLASYNSITDGVRFIDKIPRSANGKILRRDLLSLAQMG